MDWCFDTTLLYIDDLQCILSKLVSAMLAIVFFITVFGTALSIIYFEFFINIIYFDK